MTIALAGFEAFGVAIEGVKDRYYQKLLLHITAANTDVNWDFDEFSAGSLGTFWDAVDGSEPGDSALKAVRNIAPKIETLSGVGGSVLLGYSRGASAASGVYTMAVTNHFPDLTFDTANAPTSATVELTWLLKEGHEPEQGSAFA